MNVKGISVAPRDVFVKVAGDVLRRGKPDLVALRVVPADRRTAGRQVDLGGTVTGALALASAGIWAVLLGTSSWPVALLCCGAGLMLGLGWLGPASADVQPSPRRFGG